MTRLGKIYYDVGNWKDAIILFEKIINYADTQLLKFIGWYLGISYMCDNRSEKCLNLANKYFTLFPGNYANAAQLYKQWSSLAQNSSRTNNSQIVVTSDNKNTIINSTLNKSMQKNTIFDGI
jgi:tetratricopeptide (TPR) repeat protein